MKTSISRLSTAALGLLLVFEATSMFAADQPYVALANQLVGHYDGIAGPANKLRVIVQPARPSIDEQRLTVTVQGTYNGNNVQFDGFLRLEPQGNSARLIWLMRRGNDCQVDIHPEGDGFVGVSLPANCQTAFQNPTPGKWEFQTEPGSFRLRNVESGETLRFRKDKSLTK
jgi:hypothetical protein